MSSFLRTLLTFALTTCCLWVAAQRAQRLDYRINSVYEEREPTPSPDGRTLYFWRRESPSNTGGVYDPGDIWFSRRDASGQWQAAQSIGQPLNTAGHEFVLQASLRQDTLWLCQTAPGVKEVGFSYSVRTREGYWSRPVAAHIRSFRYEGNYKDFFITRDGYLLLPNETENGMGGSDLFVCYPINDTTWGPPVNLGPAVNGPGDEDAPCLSADGLTLYFNSNGHSGYGNHDVFMSRRLDNSWRNWSMPVNLGAPVNTAGYDFDFFLSADGKSAFWCSDYNSYGSNDIYLMDATDCQADIYEVGKAEPLSGSEKNVCYGQTVLLEAGFSPGTYLRYQWLKDGAALPNATERRLRVSEAGRYQVVRRRDNCQDSSAAVLVRYVDRPVAEIENAGDILCLDDSVELRSNPVRGLSYQWQLNGLDIPGAEKSYYYVKSPGEYSLRVSNGSCDDVSEALNLRRFAPPPIFTAADTVRGQLPTLPHWLWTNKIPRQKGITFIRDAAADTRGNLYVLTSTDKGGRYAEQVQCFFKEGLYRFSFPEERREDAAPGHIATDPDGNVILAGKSYYLAKYSPEGRLLWSKDEVKEEVSGLSVDPLGYIYTVGRFSDTLRLGLNRIPAPARGGFFIAKHSPRGELIWSRTYAIDGETDDFGSMVQADCNGNVLVAGAFELIANFQKTVLRASLVGENYFVAKFSPEGELTWAKTFDTPRSRNRTHDLHSDCEGNVFLAFNRELWRLGPEGAIRWHGPLAQPAGAFTLAHRIYSHEGDLYIAGITDKSDYYVAKLNRINNQAIIWQDKGAAITEFDMPAIAGDAEGHVMLAGISKGSNFPGAQFDLTSGSDAFVMKYGPPDAQFRQEPVSICKNETVALLTRSVAGVSYQWILNGRDILGATGPSYEADAPGSYQVRAMAGGCERVSDPQQLVDCEKDPMSEPPVALATTPVRQTPPPAPKVVPRPVESDIRLSSDGSPQRIRNRRIKTQEEIFIQGETATLYIWDHAAEDGDTVSINLNGQWLLENYRLKSERLVIEQTFKQGDNYIILYALNLGGTPPNTAAILIDDGYRKQSLLLRSTLKNCGMLKVRRL